ncbi:MAG TPA: TolC family protein, partial [Geobacterales bacterium]|nr:TolC family protein [Geobacterales bacterium]
MYRSLIVMLFLSTLPLRADILTLADALQQARQHNPEQAVRNRQVTILEEGVGIARSSYLPRLDLQGGYTAQMEPQAVVIGGHPMPTQDRDFLFASASLHQTIYDFGRSSGRYQRSLLLKEAAESDRQAQEQDLFLRVVQAYYGVLEAQSLLAAADDEVKQRQEHLQVATSLYEQGVVTRKDLLQAEVKRAQSQQQQLAMINLQQNQRLLLNYLIGAEATSQPALEPPLPPETTLPEADQDQALAQRSEMRQMRQLLAASEEEIKENRG